MNQLLVVTTCPDLEVARRLAHALIERRLAACVNIVPGATSVYEWQGTVAEDRELLLLIKSRGERMEAMRELLAQLHPYELPELIAMPIEDGLPAYLAWLDSQLETPIADKK
jgi:periplasmic divalent cation tolerance protein